MIIRNPKSPTKKAFGGKCAVWVRATNGMHSEARDCKFSAARQTLNYCCLQPDFQGNPKSLVSTVEHSMSCHESMLLNKTPHQITEEPCKSLRSSWFLRIRACRKEVPLFAAPESGSRCFLINNGFQWNTLAQKCLSRHHSHTSVILTHVVPNDIELEAD